MLTKIVQDWYDEIELPSRKLLTKGPSRRDSIAAEDSKALRDELLSQIARASQGPRFVLTKLCVAVGSADLVDVSDKKLIGKGILKNSFQHMLYVLVHPIGRNVYKLRGNTFLPERNSHQIQTLKLHYKVP